MRACVRVCVVHVSTPCNITVNKVVDVILCLDTSSSPERRSTYAHARRTGVTSGAFTWPINFDPVPECRD